MLAKCGPSVRTFAPTGGRKSTSGLSYDPIQLSNIGRNLPNVLFGYVHLT